MNKLVLAGTLALTLTGFGAAQYSYDDDTAALRTLLVTVDKGETESFDVSKLVPQEGVTVTNVVKFGEGKLVFDSTELPGYTFDMVVRAGVSNIRNTNQYCANPCKITVCDGATLMNDAAASNAKHSNVTTYFEGRGYDGQGALYKSSYDYGSPFGNTVVQTGDALVRLMGVENSLAPTVDQQGHKLDVQFVKYLSNEWKTFKNVSQVNFVGVNSGSTVSHELNMSTWMTITSNQARYFTFSNLVFSVRGHSDAAGSGGAAYGSGCKYDFPIAFLDGSLMQINSIWPEATSFSGNRNFWFGPVEIDEPKLTIRTTTDNDVGRMYFAFTNKVTGGGFDLVGREATKMHLHLYSGENAFTGGVSGVDAVLHDYANGAVPANGAALALTNSEFLIENDGTYLLPAAEFGGNGLVSNGFGRWNGALVKSGAGTLDYQSSLSADSLDLRGGSFVADLHARRRIAYAGVKLSTIVNTPEGKTPDISWDYAKGNTYVVSGSEDGLEDQCVTPGMDLLYSSDVLTGDKTYCYTGYIWNNSETNEMWSFAGDSTHAFRFDVDDTTLIAYWNWAGSKLMINVGYADGTGPTDIGTNTVVLTPGPHRVKYVIMQQHGATTTAQDYGAYAIGINGKFRSNYPAAGEGFENWVNNCPIMCRRGPATRDYRDYVKLVDPGDGSLLTYQLLTDESPERIGETVIRNPDIAFGSAKFAPGTSATFDGCDQTFADLAGWPTVTDADITVSDTWTIDPAEFGTTSFAITGKLTLGTDLQFVFPEGKPARQYRNTAILLGTATEGIDGTPAQPADAHWRVFVDGTSLKARYLSDGAMIIFR